MTDGTEQSGWDAGRIGKGDLCAALLWAFPAGVAELAGVKHVFVKAAARVNNRAENSHQPTRRRERAMNGFRDPLRTQVFLSIPA